MRFDWKPESKERYFRKAEAAVKAAGFDQFGRKHKSIFIHAYMILEMEEQDR